MRTLTQIVVRPLRVNTLSLSIVCFPNLIHHSAVIMPPSTANNFNYLEYKRFSTASLNAEKNTQIYRKKLVSYCSEGQRRDECVKFTAQIQEFERFFSNLK